MDLTKTPQEVYFGNPPSALHQPSQADAAVLMEEVIVAVDDVDGRTGALEAANLPARMTTVEGIATSGAALKASVATVALTNITLSGVQTVAGVASDSAAALAKGVLAIGQTAPAQNGVYIPGAGAWTRRSDLDAAGEMAKASVRVDGGDHAGRTYWQTATVTTLGTDAVVWALIADDSALVADKAGLDIASPAAQNARTASFLGRGYFVASELSGPFDETGAATDDVTYSIVDGELVVTAAAAQDERRYFGVGHRREPGASLFAEVVTTTTDTASGLGPALVIGDGAEAMHIFHAGSGSLNVRDSGFAEPNPAQSYTAVTPAAWGSGDVVTLRIVCDGEGTGYAECINNAGVSHYRRLEGIPAGEVRIMLRDGSSGGGGTVTVKSLRAEARPYVAPPAALPAPKAAAAVGVVQNLLPSDGVLAAPTLLADEASYDLGWTTGNGDSGNGTGVFSSVDMGDYLACQIVGSRSLRHRHAVSPGQPYTAHILPHEFEPNAAAGATAIAYDADSQVQVVEYTSGNVEVLRNEFKLSALKPGEPWTFTKVAEATTAKVLFRVSVAAANRFKWSHMSMAQTDKPGFYPSGETLATLDERVVVLEEGAGVLTAPRLIRWGILPDSVPGRDPAGFTSTGLTRITRGAWAGFWAVADDGRLKEGDASPYIPAIHIISPDWQRIMLTIPAGYSGNSAQGLDIDTSGSADTFWLNTAGDRKTRHYAMDGTEITSDTINYASIDGGSISGDPNALAYNPTLDALYVMPRTGSTTLRLISCDPAASPRVLQTWTMPSPVTGSGNAGTPDHFSYDVARPNSLFFTMAENGTDGKIYEFNLTTSAVTLKATLEHCQAVEGLYMDWARRRFAVVCDADYHFTNANPKANVWQEYEMPADW